MKQQWTSQVWGAALLVAAAAGCASSGGETSTGNSGMTAAAGNTGSAAGAGAAAGGGATMMETGPFACGPKSTKTGPELYSAMAMAFLPQESNPNLPCAFGSCHNMGKKAAQLALPLGGNLIEALVNKPSCEAPNLKLVEPGGGDAALKKSWLYMKLAAPVDGNAALIPDPAWGTPGQCGQMEGFGARMPISSGADGVGEAKLAVAREWICAGAPGPM